MKRQVTEALRLQFRPEFLNRIDEVIVFHALTDADLAAIVELLLADLQRRLASQDLILELTPAARSLIAREGTDPTFGARPLKRTIQRLVENPLARRSSRAGSSPARRSRSMPIRPARRSCSRPKARRSSPRRAPGATLDAGTTTRSARAVAGPADAAAAGRPRPARHRSRPRTAGPPELRYAEAVARLASLPTTCRRSRRRRRAPAVRLDTGERRPAPDPWPYGAQDPAIPSGGPRADRADRPMTTPTRRPRSS